jgi:hypothetical protein
MIVDTAESGDEGVAVEDVVDESEEVDGYG